MMMNMLERIYKCCDDEIGKRGCINYYAVGAAGNGYLWTFIGGH